MRAFPGPSVVPRDEWEMYGVALELGDWRYCLDEGGIVYGPGTYPFYTPVTTWERIPSSPLLSHAVPTGQIGRQGCGCPQVSTTTPGATSTCRWTRSTGPTSTWCWHGPACSPASTASKVMVRRIEIGLDLDAERVMLPDACPPELVEQAAMKAARALDLLRRARDERDQDDAPEPQGVLRPVWPEEGEGAADTADGSAHSHRTVGP